jgi:putative flippase GtrA
VTNGAATRDTNLAQAEPNATHHGASPSLLLQICLFLLAGGAQLVVDWLTFVLLTKFGVVTVVANITGRLVGACLGFLLNGKFTFLQKGRTTSINTGSALRFIAFWAASSLVSTVAVAIVKSHAGLQAAWLGKPVIEAILAIMSFLCSKFWIYRR